MSNPATILLVDDEEAVQKLLTFPLERDGYRVVQARDGDEALRQFDEHSVDLSAPPLAESELPGSGCESGLLRAAAAPMPPFTSTAAAATAMMRARFTSYWA